MTIRKIAAIPIVLLLASCATPYTSLSWAHGGGVKAVQITDDTFQVTSRGNMYTDADQVRIYLLRKCAETTVAAGYDLFVLSDPVDRSRSARLGSAYAAGGRHSAWGLGTAINLIAPGETVQVRMLKGPKPSPMPDGEYDAREVLKHLAP